MTNLTGKDVIVTAYHQIGDVDFIRKNAYANLTQMAKPFGKRVDNWRRLKRTQQVLEAFRQDPSYNGTTPIIALKGTKNHTSLPRDVLRLYGIGDTSDGGKAYGGTWAHPDIAIGFAQWLSPAFELWCSRQIRHLMTYGEVNLNYKEWSPQQSLQGIQYNRDDIKEMYG